MAALSRALPAPVAAPARRAAAVAVPVPRSIILGHRSAAGTIPKAVLSPATGVSGPLGATPVAPVPAPAAPTASCIDAAAAYPPRTSVVPHATAAAATAVATLDATLVSVALEAAAALEVPALTTEHVACGTTAAGDGIINTPMGAAAGSGMGAALSAAGRMLLSPYHAYAHALETHPLLTKACTSCAGFMLGDLLAQHLAGGSDLDALRLLRLGLYGLILDGPLGSAWYDLLEAKVAPERPTAATTVLAKTALDQIVYASLGTALFFTTITLLEGRPGDVASVLHAKVVPTLVANWAIWPAAHIVNFRYVPSQLRIAYNNVVSVGWLALLSAITHSSAGSLLAHIPGFAHHH